MARGDKVRKGHFRGVGGKAMVKTIVQVDMTISGDSHWLVLALVSSTLAQYKNSVAWLGLWRGAYPCGRRQHVREELQRVGDA
jgi:hypothetical protein